MGKSGISRFIYILRLKWIVYLFLAAFFCAVVASPYCLLLCEVDKAEKTGGHSHNSHHNKEGRVRWNPVCLSIKTSSYSFIAILSASLPVFLKKLISSVGLLTSLSLFIYLYKKGSIRGPPVYFKIPI